ncbi:transcriptional regulator [Oerskovia jenensis]|uniref:DNA-binding MarR family transcriptional regulator n=1 Tax=Oerskovia jenensis TaxID=162169 RepID=A0ABS2LF15_9CELL|nr:transcriptional regulator [Oerskovia jenensis]MBM7479023.1 DNA-binding MarR family transcriptional regulator [Oerskovia jenensis]
MKSLDELAYQRTRLSILALLTEAEYATFQYMKAELGLTDGNLGRHLRALEEAGYVNRRNTLGRKNWYQLTKQGGKMIDQELVKLEDLVTRLKLARNQ